ncbi:MAG TPA: hypothetical protein VL400_25060 [Polyangiaceae bacterium]|nr:hypothetical protein [Polyangiaceae bacterium]
MRQTVPMGAQPEAVKSAIQSRTTQPMGTPQNPAGLPRDTIKEPPRAEIVEPANDTSAAPIVALQSLPVSADPGELHRSMPLDMRATLPRSEKGEARAVVVPAAAVPRQPVGAKIDVSRADLRRAPTQKITRRPNEYIPGDDSDVLGPPPGARPPPGVVVGGARDRMIPLAPRAASTANNILYAIIAILCVCAVAGTVTWAVFRSRATPPPAPTQPH